MASFTVSSGVTDTSPKTVGNDDTGTVELLGTLAVTGTAITWNAGSNDPGVVIDNSGTINATTRGIDTSGTFATGSFELDNSGQLIAQTNDAFRINTNITSGSILVENSGLIVSGAVDAEGNVIAQASGQALDFNALSAPGVIVFIYNDTAGLIGASGADAIRPGTNATIDNFGTIIALGGNDGIDFQDHTGGSVSNGEGGSITGSKHGITGDSPITVVNAGTITGRLGSGINLDNANDSTANITNNSTGVITGTSDGVADGDGIDVDGLVALANHGLIEAVGISGDGLNEALAIGGGTIHNFADGMIRSDQRAITVDNSDTEGAFGAIAITNEGTIQGENGEAISINGAFADTIINKGTIFGSVSTDDGADTFELYTGSSIIGTVDGGDGADIVGLEGRGSGTAPTLVNIETVELIGGDWTLVNDGFDFVAFENLGLTLRLDQSALADGVFDATLVGFVHGDILDLKGTGLATSAALGAGNVLTVSGGSVTPIILQLDPTHDYSDQVFEVESDGAGGTLVTVEHAPVVLNGGNGADHLVGNTGDDTIRGNNGDDRLVGLDGDDALFGGNGDDELIGGRGDDELAGGNGDDLLVGGRGDDELSGGNGDDFLAGGRGDDALSGGNGDDELIGGRGDDELSGGNGDDLLAGGRGDDVLAGGNGNDCFVFGANFGDDIIADFRPGDHIAFEDGIFAELADVMDASEQVGANVVITADGDGTITLEHMTLASLAASDFLFV
jgi:hypothetical protein